MHTALSSAGAPGGDHPPGPGTVPNVATIDELADAFRVTAETQAQRAPGSARISAAVAELPEVVAILMAAPEEQQLPVLLLAALHHDVLLDPGCELAAWYATVTPTPRDDDVSDALRRHCVRRREELMATVRTRSTQTNEVGRCGFFLPAIAAIGDEVGAVSLVDVGTSGGLNLRLDEYEYHYEPGGGVGGPSDVRIEVGTRGPVPVPERMPTIVARIGLDRNPIDITDEDQTRWLRACLWPDQADRFRRLEAAIDIARAVPADIRVGDAVDVLAPAVRDAAEVGHPVIMNSWVLNYLPHDRRADYLVRLERLGAEYDLSWVYAESPAHAPGLFYADDTEDEQLTQLVLVRWRDGFRSIAHLATSHPHGYWLHWRAEPCTTAR